MQTTINVTVLEQYRCLEPAVGIELLPFAPDCLTAEELAQFELHREGCEFCQERWKLWQVTGAASRLEALLQRVKTLLTEQRYAEAIQAYNRALAIDPNILTTPAGQECFRAETQLPLMAARLQEKDLMPYIAPSYAPEVYALAAAEAVLSFPVVVEYAAGQIKGKFTAAGQQVFFELLEASGPFQAGITLIGRLTQQAVVSCQVWEITPGQRQRLGTITALFGAAEWGDIVEALRAFRVFPARPKDTASIEKI